MTSSPIKGRGAASRPDGRFQRRKVAFDPALADDPAPTTTLTAMRARSIISSNASPDIPFDRSINTYQGCEHGCIYCYARPSHSYLDLSPGLDFESRIFYKPNAVQCLLAEWQRPGYAVKPITIGANTDPYQPAEKKLGLTRALLEEFLRYRHPVSLITKGILMHRDIDLLAELGQRGLCSVAVSIPTADDALKRILEPRVPAAARRFKLISALREAGIPVTLLMAPIIPAINDCEIESIIASAASAGAERAGWVLLRLPHELKSLVREWLQTHYPDRAGHVLSLLRQASGGRDYDNRFGVRQTGSGVYAAMLKQRFSTACKRAGIVARDNWQQLDCSQFLRPGGEQISLPLG